MRQTKTNLRRDQSGFTLIELLIVIIILGVLAGVAVFAVSAFRGEGASEACKTDEQTIIVALEAYNQKNGSYPEPDGVADAENNNAADYYGPINDGNGGDILKTVPSWNNYIITYDDSGDVSVANTSGTALTDCDAV